MWQNEPGPAVGDKDSDAHSPARRWLLPGPEKRCHWDLQNSILPNSQKHWRELDRPGMTWEGPSSGTTLLVSERRWDGRCVGRDWVTRTGPRTRSNSGVKAPHMMVLSEGSFLGVLSPPGLRINSGQVRVQMLLRTWLRKEQGDGAPHLKLREKVPIQGALSVGPRGSPRLADTSTDTDSQMDRDGAPPLLCVQRHLEYMWLEWSAEAWSWWP